MRSSLTLVLGGARSGKSNFAERLARGLSENRIYIASAEARDDEMKARVEAHKAARANDGWLTIESPLDAAANIAGRSEGEVVLFDCATLWLSNHMFAGSDIAKETARLIEALAATPADIVMVSNETGLGIVPDNALARQFNDEQGLLNQKLAAKSDRVIAVMAGLPLALKGDLPSGLA